MLLGQMHLIESKDPKISTGLLQRRRFPRERDERERENKLVGRKRLGLHKTRPFA